NDSVIAQLNPEQRLTLASTTKIVVAAAALNIWAADRMFQTQVYATAPLDAGQVNGDLILRGGGDPSLTNEALWVMASQLKGAGLKAVSG
ncbi:D-alanyl-D-alanine carboxypeptidase, partial [Acinetobacter baumannii]